MHLPKFFFLSLLLLVSGAPVLLATEEESPPLRLAVVGVTHGHVHGLLRRIPSESFDLVALFDPDASLVESYARRYEIPQDRIYTDLEEMLDNTRPEAVAAFNPISEHIDVVRAAAPRGIHIMVEKPLAFRWNEAREIRELAKRYEVQVLTNYETTWYPSTYFLARQQIDPREFRKFVVHDGHPGPREIGVSPEFFDWLTDPAKNGGGALIDFGCYGANLISWLMAGERPLSVTAVTQQIKPDVYPRVDDEATILLTYPRAQGVIQASWNWPFNRKDIEVYTRDSSLHALDATQLRIRRPGTDERLIRVDEAPFSDPFAYLRAVIRGETQLRPQDLSALELNLTVVEILDAARTSARTGQTVYLSRTRD